MTMEKYNKIFDIKAVIIMTVAMLMGCQYKDFDDYQVSNIQQQPVDIHFDWTHVDSIPQKMRIAFYREENNSLYNVYNTGNRDTTVMVNAGQFNVTAWNGALDVTSVESFENRLNVNAVAPKYQIFNSPRYEQLLDSIFEGQQIIEYPDYMVHATAENVFVDVLNERQRVVIRPDSMVITMNIQIKGIKGLDKCRQVRGALNNVAGRRYISYEKKTVNPSTVMFDATINEKDSTVTASFWVFDLKPTEELKDMSKKKVVIFFWLITGQVYYAFDATEAFANAVQKNKAVLNIKIDDINLDLNDYLQSADAFIVSSEGWSDGGTTELGF